MLPGSYHRCGTLGAGGQKLQLVDCDGALSTARSSCFGGGGVVVCVCLIMYYLVCLHLYEIS